MPKSIIIVGAGPAGLTAAAEAQEAHGAHVTVLEKDPVYVGGISRTAHYKDYRFDIGGHRFFSKSDEVTQWWKRRLPDDFIKVRRMSRIFYRGTFFDYPLKAFNALSGLGIFTSAACMLSYGWARLFPTTPEKSFADWVSNRFGKKLFNIFFKTYTEKVWGIPCDQISADWAAQRIKGLSLLSAVMNALLPGKSKGKDGSTIKTLIDAFEYPRLGPGMMWEKTRDDLVARGGAVHMGLEAVRITHADGKITGLVTRNAQGAEQTWTGDAYLVSMPLRETVLAFDPPLPEPVRTAAKNLAYRDFLTVALMIRQKALFPDNWIYVHDASVKLGRIQNFNNWSPAMVPHEGVTCLGLEYFCFEGDGLWTSSDEDLIALGKKEVAQLGLVDPNTVFDGCVVRQPKAYPVYDPGYQANVETIRGALGMFPNLQPAGRNGLHKYNNQDHSMMTALLAARNLASEAKDAVRYDVWKVNTDAEYHEEGGVDDLKTGRQVPHALEKH
jgi:protoporphyrinogen oxidase